MGHNGVCVSVLVDDTSYDKLAHEHGLALWVEAGGRRILFDTGQGPALETNARRMGAPIWKADHVVLSHGHYDHTGGLAPVIAQGDGAVVHHHPDATRTRYAVDNGSARSVGMPPAARAALDGLPPERRHRVTRPQELAEGVGLTGPAPRETPYEDTGGPFFYDPEGTRPDPLHDDLSLWAVSRKGLVLVLGCCHAGVVNTVHAALAASGQERLHAVVGGMHLFNASDERMTRTAQVLADSGVERVIPLHCTGKKAVANLRQALGNRVEAGKAGMVFDF